MRQRSSAVDAPYITLVDSVDTVSLVKVKTTCLGYLCNCPGKSWPQVEHLAILECTLVRVLGDSFRYNATFCYQHAIPHHSRLAFASDA